MNPNLFQKDIYKFLSTFIEKAISLNASDIHIDPKQLTVDVRFRVAGNLHDGGNFDRKLLDIFIGKIKVLASLRSDIHDKSQDGRFYFVSNISGERVDARVSIAPTFYGENCVMRLLRPEVMRFNTFKELGMTSNQIHQYTKALHKSSGLIIIAGPTGSGKTSTLYSTLRYLVKGDNLSDFFVDKIVNNRNIVTIEDPVESALSDIRQIQVSSDKDFGFKEALRGILRQDPDIVMIGEIRDKETALAAIQTSLTGHLVLTTIHAPNASAIIPRLIDMGIEPYMLSSSVSVILSQRLVRVFDYDLGLYGDRKGVFEIIPIDKVIRKMIHEKKTPYEIEKHLEDTGHLLLRDACKDMYTKHVTTQEEIRRISLDIYS